ncbi:hypothetical protein GGR34_000943 [Microvirga flocculans]|uniref:Uncharacterized protein n=1 Tax=Microvirga flocculans TaxID=217168 RepID=A0A7W6ID55_9HYPH|nr:hypothetical protein [Microvirga flocculans]
MIIVAALKAIREVLVEAVKLRRELAKRYPGVMAE